MAMSDGSTSSGINVATATESNVELIESTNNNNNNNVEEKEEKKKMFFTTSDLIDRMNSAINNANNDDDDDEDDDDIVEPNTTTNAPSKNSNNSKRTGLGGGFELQRKMSDGSYRKADTNETAAADFQAKMKQASEMIANLNPDEKIEWARFQRLEGNKLFAKGEYKDAMDVYLTCLVAMDQTPASSSSSSSSDDDTTSTNTNDNTNTIPLTNNDEPSSDSNKSSSSSTSHSQSQLQTQKIEEEIKLPVLLNLALAAYKLGTYTKSHKFCDFALDMESGRQSVKAHFRRGSVRMMMGDYEDAERDLDRALTLSDGRIERSEAGKEEEDGDDGEDGTEGGAEDAKEARSERAAILREKRKLSRLVHQAEKNRKLQKKAMEKLFRSAEDDRNNPTPNAGSAEGAASSLYPERKGPKPQQIIAASRYNDGDDELFAGEDRRLSCFGWYVRMMGRCAQKLLDVIGEDDEGGDYAADIRRRLEEDKKDA